MNCSLLPGAVRWLPVLLLALPGWASPPLSPRTANYQIEVRLNDATKRLDGRQTLTWRNTSADVIRELWFHLYLNAFRNDQSTFMRESGETLRGDNQADQNRYGWTRLTALTDRRTGENLLAAVRFAQPDDGNPDDRTVIRVPLGRPLNPGETIVLGLAFQAKLPRIVARTGFSRDFVLAGQWFPKIAVYEAAGVRGRTQGGWNCHQFHANTEFYADYGTYDVTITTRQDLVVGATGQLVRETRHRDGTKSGRWQAADVVDFAWTASPRFEVVDDHWRGKTGNDVRLRLLLQPEHRNQARRHLDAAKRALTYFDQHLGVYPFATLTIVVPPYHASRAGGMEYPTFITAGTSWALPAGLRYPEVVTVHEFGHQYFMQLLASNEFEEAWLDEGFNQYFEGRIMDAWYGPRQSVVDWLGIRVGDLELSRSGYVHLDNPAIGPAYGNAWQLPAGYYGALTYQKTATWLRTLEGLVGRLLMDEIMQTYYRRWRFRHPNAQSFIDVVNELVPRRLGYRYGTDMNWFFEQVLFGDRVCDYKLVSIRNGRQPMVRVDRLGDMQLPVDVLVQLANGTRRTFTWDGKARSQTFALPAGSRVSWAQVDPAQKLYMDINLNNNSLTLNPSSAPFAKLAASFLFWLEWLMLA